MVNIEFCNRFRYFYDVNLSLMKTFYVYFENLYIPQRPWWSGQVGDRRSGPLSSVVIYDILFKLRHFFFNLKFQS